MRERVQTVTQTVAGKDGDVPRPTPAQEALRSALVSLMLQKPLPRINVKELCAVAFVSRSTFYAYYDSIDQLLCELEDAHVRALRAFNEPVEDPGVAGTEAMGFYDATIAYIHERERDFRALLVTCQDTRFVEKWKAAIKDHLRNRRRHARATDSSELSLELAASSVTSASAYLLRHPQAATESDIRTILSKVLAALDS